MYWARGRLHPGQVAGLSKGLHIHTQIHTYKCGSLELPVHLNVMSLDCGRRQGTEQLENCKQMSDNAVSHMSDFHSSSQGTNIIRRNQDSN